MDFYLARSTASAPVRVIMGEALPRSGKPRGKIVVSSQPIKAGEVVFREKPLAAMQTVENKALVPCCAHCHRFIGDLNLHADILAGVRSRLSSSNLPAEDRCLPIPKIVEVSSYVGCDLVSCPSGCGEVYCSPACRDSDASAGHSFLCTGPHNQDHPLVSFKIHAVQTNDIFLFAGKVIADVLLRFCRSSGDIDQAWLPYSRFVQEPWWEVVNSPEDALSPDNFANRLRTVASESYNLLSKHLQAWFLDNRNASHFLKLVNTDTAFESFMSFFTLDRWGRIIGMFEQNQIGVRVPSPLGSLLKKLPVLSSREAEHVTRELLGIVQYASASDDEHSDNHCTFSANEEDETDLVDTLILDDDLTGDALVSEPTEDEVSTHIGAVDAGSASLLEMEEMCRNADMYFPPLDGMAMFTLACCMNHSCDPNVRVTWCNEPGAPIEIELVSLRPIAKGEELCFSYISTEINSVEERRLALIDYGFECECTRCMREEVIKCDAE
eukprot:g1849.t1